MCIFLHKNIWVCLTNAVSLLLTDYFCTPCLFKDAWLLLNIANVHSSLFNMLCHNDLLCLFLFIRYAA